MTMRSHRGQRGGPRRGVPGAGSTPARLELFAGCGPGVGANRVAALPFGTEFRTGKRVGLNHLRNSVPKVAQMGCKCGIPKVIRIITLPLRTQFVTGQKRERAPVRNSVPHGEKRVRRDHPRNSVSRVAETRCKGRISKAIGPSALPFETQFRTGKRVSANHLRSFVPKVAGTGGFSESAGMGEPLASATVWSSAFRRSGLTRRAFPGENRLKAELQTDSLKTKVGGAAQTHPPAWRRSWHADVSCKIKYTYYFNECI